MAVTNVFGERLWIEAADQGTDNAWGRWSIFTINVRNAPEGSSSADTTLLLLPILSSAQIGPMQEEVSLVRDEVANMAWGVERTVPLGSGISRPGGEVAKQTFNYLQSLVQGGGAPPQLAAAVRYQAMNSVPENWIPFIPVHVPNQSRDSVATRGYATHSDWRSQRRSEGAATDFVTASRTRCHSGANLFSA